MYEIPLKAQLHPQPPVCQVVHADERDARGLNTSAIQTQLDICGNSAANLVSVELASARGTDFVSGPLYIPSNVMLWLDAGVVLNASSNPADFQRTATSRTMQCDSSSPTIPICGSLAVASNGCQALINACKVSNAGVGGQGTIEGHGWDTLAEGSTGGSTWWGRSVTAKVSNYAVNLNAPIMITFSKSTGLIFTDFTIHNAPRFHMSLVKDTGITITGLTIVTPTSDHTIASFPYNTDGIDPSGSSNIKIDHVDITAGDDNIAFKAGSNGPINNVAVSNSTLRAGHGLSIGSETNSGVTNVSAANIRFIGTDNGLRIKSDLSRGGIVDNIRYTNICVQGVKNPIVIDPAYSSASGNLPPQYRNIRIANFYADAGNLTLSGLSGQQAMNLTLNNVVIDQVGAIAAANVNIAESYDPGYPYLLPIPAVSGVIVTQTVAPATRPADIKSYCLSK